MKGKPIGCVLGLGECWIERVPEETTFMHLVVRVPSRPDDIESKPRDYTLTLDGPAASALVQQILDAAMGVGT